MTSNGSVSNGKVNGMDPSHYRSGDTSSNNDQDLKKIFDAAVNIIRSLPAEAGKDGKIYL